MADVRNPFGAPNRMILNGNGAETLAHRGRNILLGVELMSDLFDDPVMHNAFKNMLGNKNIVMTDSNGNITGMLITRRGMINKIQATTIDIGEKKKKSSFSEELYVALVVYDAAESEQIGIYVSSLTSDLSEWTYIETGALDTPTTVGTSTVAPGSKISLVIKPDIEIRELVPNFLNSQYTITEASAAYAATTTSTKAYVGLPETLPTCAALTGEDTYHERLSVSSIISSFTGEVLVETAGEYTREEVWTYTGRTYMPAGGPLFLEACYDDFTIVLTTIDGTPSDIDGGWSGIDTFGNRKFGYIANKLNSTQIGTTAFDASTRNATYYHIHAAFPTDYVVIGGAGYLNGGPYSALLGGSWPYMIYDTTYDGSYVVVVNGVERKIGSIDTGGSCTHIFHNYYRFSMDTVDEVDMFVCSSVVGDGVSSEKIVVAVATEDGVEKKEFLDIGGLYQTFAVLDTDGVTVMYRVGAQGRVVSIKKTVEG